ncbi:MAG: hypothetical protein P9X24_05050 [Candidatus Hatepunaea meridiana]|nr:hypothetical protein [Candidatus Hatepunaea meridiana]
MPEEQVAKIIFFKMKLSNYKLLQSIVIPVAFIAMALAFIFLRNSEDWLLNCLWWVLLIAIVAEIIETMIVIGNAKKKMDQ